MEFVCGGRALARFQSLRDHLAAATRRLSVLPGELAPAIERLQNEARDSKRASATLQTDLARYRAQDMLAVRRARFGPALAVCQVVEGEMTWLKLLAARVHVRTRTRRRAGLERDAGRAWSLPPRRTRALRRTRSWAELLTRFGGRGGGKADLAQGGGLDSLS